MGEKLLEAMGIKSLVPKKGLEPPHPCGYMDLNHARLPIPPLRRVTNKTAKPAVLRKNYGSIVTGTLRSVKPAAVLMSSSTWGGLDLKIRGAATFRAQSAVQLQGWTTLKLQP